MSLINFEKIFQRASFILYKLDIQLSMGFEGHALKLAFGYLNLTYNKKRSFFLATTLMNNGFLREIEKTFVSTAVEPTTSLQLSTTEMGSTLPETALEGATLPLFFKVLIEGSLSYKSEEAQTEIEKTSLTPSIPPLLLPFLPQQVITKMTPLNESKEKEEIVSRVAKRDLSSKSEAETERDLTSLSQKVRSKRSILSHEKEAK
jgi:hypothetical protein